MTQDSCREQRRRQREHLQLKGVSLATQAVMVWAGSACLDDVTPSASLSAAIGQEHVRLRRLAAMTAEERAEHMSSYDSSIGSLDELCRMILQRLLGVARRAGDGEHAAAYEAALDGRDIEVDMVTMRRVPMRGPGTAGCFA